MKICEVSECYEIEVAPFGKPSIYALVDPDENRVRYIGKSVQPTVRYYNHLSDSSRKESALYVWIRELLNTGKFPKLFILEECEESALEEREKHWIRNINNSGHRLLNFGGRRHFEYQAANLSKIAELHGGKYISSGKDSANAVWVCSAGHGEFTKLISSVVKGHWCNSCTKIEKNRTGITKEELIERRYKKIQTIVAEMLT